jgi:hypothetical protein
MKVFQTRCTSQKLPNVTRNAIIRRRGQVTHVAKWRELPQARCRVLGFYHLRVITTGLWDLKTVRANLFKFAHTRDSQTPSRHATGFGGDDRLEPNRLRSCFSINGVRSILLVGIGFFPETMLDGFDNGDLRGDDGTVTSWTHTPACVLRAHC